VPKPALRRLPDVLAFRAAARPDRVAHDDTSRSLTFGQWHEEAGSVAGGLVTAGLSAGDRVLLPVSNKHAVDFAVAFMGVQRAGGLAVPVSPRSSTEELAAFRDLVDARWCLTDAADKCAGLPFAGMWAVDQPPREPASAPDPDSLPAADADILSTSGTTGRPKGVVFTHEDLLDRMGDPEDWSRAGTFLHALPFTGFGGCHGMMLSTLQFGHTLVTQPSFDAAGYLRLAEQHRPQTLHLVPSMIRLIFELPDHAAADLSSVRWIITGTAPLPADSVQRLTELWPHIRVINTYGMTEGAVGISTRSRESALKPGSIGRPDDPDGVQIRDDSGAVLPPGQTGEIWTRVRHPRRYWNDPEATAAAWRDGWLATGDVGYVDPDGDVILTGRSKELIIRGGYNIAPAEVEDVLHAHPDVVEAAVVGVPHDVLGEDVASAVTLRTGASVTEQDLREWCRGHLADNKVPRVVVVLDELPHNQNAKVVKRELQPMLAEAARQARATGSRRSAAPADRP
jgi:long-chain acyl-CoA synthetase